MDKILRRTPKTRLNARRMMATFGADVRDVAERLSVTVDDVESLIYEFCTLSAQVVGIEGFSNGLPDDGRAVLVDKLERYLSMDLSQVEGIEALVRGIDAPLDGVLAPEAPDDMNDAQKKSD